MGRKTKLKAGLDGLFSTSPAAEAEAGVTAAVAAPGQTRKPAAKTRPVSPAVLAGSQESAAGQVAARTAPRPDDAGTPPRPEPVDKRLAAGRHDEQLVVFVLANEHYGVGISAVDSIIKLQPITYVPRAPAFVEGVTNLRGRVLPVIDLRKRFGLPAADASRETRIIVTQMNGTSAGMIVDAVTEVLRMAAEEVEPPSPLVVTLDSAFITGIAKVGERLIIVLDLEKVLSVGEKADLQAMER